MIVLGLMGKARSGKDTAAAVLVEEFGFRRYAFADLLKDAFAKYHDIPRCWCDGVDQLAQKIAMEADFAEDFRAVITDVRFENELEYLRDMFSAKIVGVVRPGGASVAVHESEALADLVSEVADSVVLNDRSLEFFQRNVRRLAERLGL